MLGGASSGKSVFAERLAADLGGDEVLYVATAVVGDDGDLARRVTRHRERRPEGWGTLELGGGDLGVTLKAAGRWRVVLLDSLTLWVSARTDGEGVLEDLERFIEGAKAAATPVILVSDEVGFGVVPESGAGRRFRDLLGAVNQRAAEHAEEVYLCVAGIATRIK